MTDYFSDREAVAITVTDLIKALSDCDPNARVWADGCDCCNPVTLVQSEGQRVTLEVNA